MISADTLLVVTDAAAVEKAVAEVAKDFGKIDVMVANAGKSSIIAFGLYYRTIWRTQLTSMKVWATPRVY